MNWNKIKEKCPKAWELFRQSDYYGLQQQNHRIFFDFFDEQGIIISIFGWHTFGVKILYSNIGYSDSETNMVLSETGDNDDYKTRTLAEEKAFEKAFEILETKLKAA